MGKQGIDQISSSARELLEATVSKLDTPLSDNERGLILQECVELEKINPTLGTDFISLLPEICKSESTINLSFFVEQQFWSKPWEWRPLSAFYQNLIKSSTVLGPKEFPIWVELGGVFSKKQMEAGVWFWKNFTGSFQNLKSEKNRIECLTKLLELSKISWMTAFSSLQKGSSLSGIISPNGFSHWLSKVTEIAYLDVASSLTCLEISEKTFQEMTEEQFLEWMDHGKLFAEYGNKISRAYFRNTSELLKKMNTESLGIWVELVVHLLEKTKVMKPDVKKERNIVGKTVDRLSHDEIRRRKDEHLEVTLQLINNTTKVLEKMTIHQLEDWVNDGIEVIESEPNAQLRLRKGKIFFSLQSQTSHDAADRFKYSVHLKHIHENLKYFVQALYGTEILIKPTQALGGKVLPFEEEQSVSDGEKIYLPSRVSRFKSEVDNYNFYKIMVAHEMSHILNGTYTADWARPPEIIPEWMNKKAMDSLKGQYWQFFELFPNSTFARLLFEWVEDDRVDLYLFREYPGLKRDAGELLINENKPKKKTEKLHLGTVLQNFHFRMVTGETLDSLSRSDMEILDFLDTAYAPL